MYENSQNIFIIILLYIQYWLKKQFIEMLHTTYYFLIQTLSELKIWILIYETHVIFY